MDANRLSLIIGMNDMELCIRQASMSLAPLILILYSLDRDIFLYS